MHRQNRSVGSPRRREPYLEKRRERHLPDTSIRASNLCELAAVVPCHHTGHARRDRGPAGWSSTWIQVPTGWWSTPTYKTTSSSRKLRMGEERHVPISVGCFQLHLVGTELSERVPFLIMDHRMRTVLGSDIVRGAPLHRARGLLQDPGGEHASGGRLQRSHRRGRRAHHPRAIAAGGCRPGRPRRRRSPAEGNRRSEKGESSPVATTYRARSELDLSQGARCAPSISPRATTTPAWRARPRGPRREVLDSASVSGCAAPDPRRSGHSRTRSL